MANADHILGDRNRTLALQGPEENHVPVCREAPHEGGEFLAERGIEDDVVLQDQEAGQTSFPGVADHLKMAEQAAVRTSGMPPCRGQFESAAVDGGDSVDPADVMPSQSGLQSHPGIEIPIQIDAGLVGEHFVDVAAGPPLTALDMEPLPRLIAQPLVVENFVDPPGWWAAAGQCGTLRPRPLPLRRSGRVTTRGGSSQAAKLRGTSPTYI